MKRKLLIFLGLCMCVGVALAQERSFEEVDAYALAAPKSIQHDLGKLSAYLAKPGWPDRQKVRAFYIWITHNIRYNVQDFNSIQRWGGKSGKPKLRSYEVKQVIKKHRAVCHGYSKLFQAMCDAAGIKSHYVTGWSREPSRAKPVGKIPDHAWNIVYVEGQWQLIDATWGAGYLEATESGRLRFKQSFSEDYFLSEPSKFVQDHLPAAPMWQLLLCPVPLQAFSKGPTAIGKALNTAACQFSYRDSIARWEVLNEDEKSLKLAQYAYQFDANKQNSNQLAHAYLKQATGLYNSWVDNQPSKPEGLRMLQETLALCKHASLYAKGPKLRGYITDLRNHTSKTIRSVQRQ